MDENNIKVQSALEIIEANSEKVKQLHDQARQLANSMSGKMDKETLMKLLDIEAAIINTLSNSSNLAPAASSLSILMKLSGDENAVERMEALLDEVIVEMKSASDRVHTLKNVLMIGGYM